MTKTKTWRCAVAGAGALAGAGSVPALDLGSGIDTQFFDDGVRAQDDFYHHVNGKWLKDTEIPADKGTYGSFVKLSDDTQEQLRAAIERLPQSKDADDPVTRKVIDLYASFIDEPELEALDLKPLAKEFAAIAAIKSKSQSGWRIGISNARPVQGCPQPCCA